MAASGTIDCNVASTDYGGGSGAKRMICHMRWNLSDANVLSLSYWYSESVSGNAEYWGVCGTSSYKIYCRVQMSTNGTTWVDIPSMSAQSSVVECCAWCDPLPLTNVYNLMQTMVNSLGSYQLTEPCYIRVAYGSSTPPAPTPSLPNAFPYYVTTGEAQIPVPIPVVTDYIPGEILDNNNSWQSHNRTGGTAKIYNGSTWLEMKTKNGPTESGDPPMIYHSTGWKNMRKIGNGA